MDQGGGLDTIIELHDGGLVAAAVAVVGGREDGDDVVVLAPLEAVHDELVGARDEREAVGVVEGLGDVEPERVAGAARADPPAAAVVGVGPQQVAHGPLVRHLLDAVELADVVERVDAGRQPAVQAKHLVVDQRRQRQVVKQVREQAPGLGGAVFAQALVVEPVHLRDLARLVVPPENGDAVRVSQLGRDEQRHGLDGVVAAIHVVAEEQVVGGGQRARDAEELN